MLSSLPQMCFLHLPLVLMQPGMAFVITGRPLNFLDSTEHPFFFFGGGYIFRVTWLTAERIAASFDQKVKFRRIHHQLVARPPHSSNKQIMTWDALKLHHPRNYSHHLTQVHLDQESSWNLSFSQFFFYTIVRITNITSFLGGGNAFCFAWWNMFKFMNQAVTN